MFSTHSVECFDIVHVPVFICGSSFVYFDYKPLTVSTGPTKNRPDGPEPPGAVPTLPVIQLLNVQKGINRTQITCSLLAQYLHFVIYKTNMEKLEKIT